jgi:glycosyltransferase involved in cell wall biosynthesis
VVNLGALAPWGSPVLAAMASGRPLVASENPQTSQRVGPTAYLVSPGEGRALGAAMTTLVVETELAEGLGQSAAERASRWNSAGYAEKLLAIYRDVLAER